MPPHPVSAFKRSHGHRMIKIFRDTIVSRAYLIVGLFIALMLCNLLVVRFQMKISHAVRAYVGGEGLWAKAQKDALRSLERYTFSHAESDYQRYLRLIQVPLGDRRARLELQKTSPDMEIVRSGFLQGRIHPDDVDALAWFFRRFQHTFYMSRAIQNWTRGDQLIDELQSVAEALHAEINSGRTRLGTVRSLYAELEVLNIALTKEEDAFSATLSEGARWTNKVLQLLTYVLALLFAALGIGLSLQIISRIRATEKALSESEQQVRKLNEELEQEVEERTGELLAAQEELVRKQKLAVLGQLAGIVGHELRNPLGVINNAIYFLKKIVRDADEAVQDNMNIIKSEVDNSLRIISDLLDFARSRTPQLKVTRASEFISQTIKDTPLPETIKLHLDVSETIPAVNVDPLQMAQVFRNLITNGIQAMPHGGDLELKAQEDKASGTLRISVIDSGEGISQENLKKLFQPLFTTKPRGIGLGLTVVKNLTETNGGTIEVKSEPGKGSIFTVILPVAQEGGRST